MWYNEAVMADQSKEQIAAPGAENIRLPERNFEIPEEAEGGKERPAVDKEKQPPSEAMSVKRLLRRPAVVRPVIADPLTQKIEKILEENVGDAYSRLSPIAKQEFKLKGEKVADKISILLKSTHIKVKKIFQLILEWLRFLPGVNHFFLEQEAKIKTDRIIALHKK